MLNFYGLICWPVIYREKNRNFYGGKSVMLKIKLSLCMTWWCNGWVEIQLHPFWTSVGGGVNCVTSSVTLLVPMNREMGGALTRFGSNIEQKISCPCYESNPDFLEMARSLVSTLTESVRLHKYEGLMYNSLYYVCVLIQKLQTEYKIIGPICPC